MSVSASVTTSAGDISYKLVEGAGLLNIFSALLCLITVVPVHLDHINENKG